MNPDQNTSPDSLSLRLEDLSSHARERFKAELRSGGDPRIEDYLEGLGEVVRGVVFRALLATRRDWAIERSEPLNLDAIASQFPEYAKAIEEVFGTDDPTMTTPDRSPNEETLNSGQTIGEPTGSPRRYSIIRQHARGGLGVVKLALDQELHREVALKEIRSDSADDEQYRARFLREAEVTARLEHPGIIPVYGIGRHRDGRPFYIMRFIRGETLKDAIVRLHKAESESESEGQSDPPRQTLHRLVGRLIDACHALAYAHHRKILHRDIKPGNIMLGPFGETLVVDWGLAKTIGGAEIDDESEGNPTLRSEFDSQVTPTRVGSKLGTVGYMSPEQADGKVAELGPTSDIYSLGVTLYYLITGKPPFENSGEIAFLKRVGSGDFRKPREVDGSVPWGLEAICLKAMALRPADRYPSAEALAEDLERWRAGQPVEAYPEPPIDRFARWSKRHRTALVGSAVLLVSTTVGLAVVTVQEQRKNRRISQEVTIARDAEAAAVQAGRVADDARLAAIEDRAAAREDLKATRQTLRHLINELSGPELGYLPNSGGPRFLLAGNVLSLYEDLIVKHPDDPDVKSELVAACHITANIGRSIALFDDAEKLYARGIALLEKLLEETPGSDEFRVELALSLVDRGENFRTSGQPRTAEKTQRRVFDVLAERKGVAPAADERYRRAEALALIDLSGALYESNRPLEAQPLAEKAAGLLKPLAEKPGASLIDRLYHVIAIAQRAQIATELGHRDEAHTHFEMAERLISELRRVPETDSPDLRFADAMIRGHQGPLFAAEGRPAEALKAYDAALTLLFDIVRNNFQPYFLQQELARTRINRASTRLELLGPDRSPEKLKLVQDDLIKAHAYLEPLVERTPRHYDFQAQLGRGHEALARLALIKGQTEEARGLFEKSIEHFRRAYQFNEDDQESRTREANLRRELEKTSAENLPTASGPDFPSRPQPPG